jgi:hypothetical protein
MCFSALSKNLSPRRTEKLTLLPCNAGATSRQPRNIWESIESGVEAQDARNSMLLRDKQMHGIAGRELRMPQHDFFRAICRGTVNRQYLIGNAKQSARGRLDGVAAVNGDLSVKIS